ncbi:glycosyltransferase [Sedimentimonas flavescens]|uniref:Glycosyltransferase n=1 Tax=Sedimentimonas flavescens TaxID=2851012 RepID=A0ABT2ZV95_9RHOB|nr:glycosyltransferase [Sedimentimonas flavescens]MCV2877672.1 glycosyltransferase [Sedimentimonas flavescens]
MTETTERPLVTFALFAYNQEKYIREAVEGAFSQTYEPLEIILSDDCSSDRTFEIMEEMASAYSGPHRVKVRRGETNKGLAGHINEVIAASEGDIISWAAGDDIALPERTSIFAQALINDSTLCGVHSDVIEIDVDGNTIRERRHSEKEYRTNLIDAVNTGQSVITQSHAFRRSVFTTFGPFRTDLTQEGIAMAFRESALGKVAFVDKCLTLYRVGSGVSTYSGGDLEKRKRLEPIKYTNWYLSAFRQMQEDSKMLPKHLSRLLENKLRRNVLFYSNLLKINDGRGLIIPLLLNIMIAPLDTKSIRAVARRVTPGSIYSKLIR